MKYELYEVGGKVRDELLGLKSKDVDYAVVLLDIDMSPELAFDNFCVQLESEGYEIFLKTKSCLTIRAMFPKGHVHSGVADFVLSRKETGYVPNTREPIVVLGNLTDDLIRRDFTLNALAKDSQGNIIDLFNGERDLRNGILRTPLDTALSFNNDPLRIVRGLRFVVTKGFTFSDEVVYGIQLFDAKKMSVVSDERIREELHKMFHFNTRKTLDMLFWLRNINYKLYNSIFKGDMWFLPTNKK